MAESSARNVSSTSPWQPTPQTFFALSIVLMVYPGMRMWIAYGDLYGSGAGREAWWSLWGVVVVGHWLCTAVCASALTSEGGGWRSIGLDWNLFVRFRWIFVFGLALACLVAYRTPDVFYGPDLPDQMRSHPLGPVSAGERSFWIVVASTAGITEEILFRGYAITRVKRFLGVPAAVVLSVTSFTLMHGPSAFDARFLTLYLVSGLLFSILFLAFKSRRLEWLMVVHATLDMALICAP